MSARSSRSRSRLAVVVLRARGDVMPGFDDVTRSQRRVRVCMGVWFERPCLGEGRVVVVVLAV